ncbi:hypothetical protein BC830DRAFT_1143269, partial [Chytriomyces sp. MP71]
MSPTSQTYPAPLLPFITICVPTFVLATATVACISSKSLFKSYTPRTPRPHTQQVSGVWGSISHKLSHCIHWE